METAGLKPPSSLNTIFSALGVFDLNKFLALTTFYLYPFSNSVDDQSQP